MLRISLVGDSYADIDSTFVTIDDDALSCWDAGAGRPIARYGLAEVLSISIATGEPRAVAKKRDSEEHPNAYRRWSQAEEDTIIEAYHRGDAFEQIAATVGRRVGGVRSRLILLGIIEPEPGDRISWPGLQSVAAEPGRGRASVASAGAEAGGLDAGGLDAGGLGAGGLDAGLEAGPVIGEARAGYGATGQRG